MYMVELFQREWSVISKNIKEYQSIFEEGELEGESNVQNLHITNSGKPVKFYNLDVIISVGYRVKSVRGTQFRRWALEVLKEYFIKGNIINNDLLKQADGRKYWNELKQRLKEEGNESVTNCHQLKKRRLHSVAVQLLGMQEKALKQIRASLY